MFQVAAAYKQPCFVYVRNGGPVEPSVLNALQEVLADAAIAGASLQVVRITSMALGLTPAALAMMNGAREHGSDVTTEAYSYTAGMTDISSAVLPLDGSSIRVALRVVTCSVTQQERG